MAWEVGQKVIKRGNRNIATIETIERVTPSGLAVVKGVHFNQDGHLRGGGMWDTTYIKPATAEDIEEITKSTFVRKTKDKLFNIATGKVKIDYAMAVKIMAVLDVDMLLDMTGDTPNEQ